MDTAIYDSVVPMQGTCFYKGRGAKWDLEIRLWEPQEWLAPNAWQTMRGLSQVVGGLGGKEAGQRPLAGSRGLRVQLLGPPTPVPSHPGPSSQSQLKQRLKGREERAFRQCGRHTKEDLVFSQAQEAAPVGPPI